MDKKVKFVELKKNHTSNDVHNDIFENKNPKKKMYDRSSTELNDYTKEKTCTKDIEQNITDSYSRKNESQKRKSEINALANISLGNNCSIDNDNVPTKKLKKKRNRNKNLNLTHTNTNHDSDEIFGRLCKEVNDSDYRENVNQIIKPELNASSDISLENKCCMDNNNVFTKKPKKKKMHNKSLNTTTEAAINLLDKTFVEMNEQNINDSFSRKNVSRKRKSELNALANISSNDNYNIDNVNVPTKKTKKKTNNDESLNSIEFNTNHNTKIQIFERTYEIVNDQNINNSDFRENVNRTIRPKLNTSSEISSENKCSMDYDNVAIEKPKKKKKLNKSLDLIKLNTINDEVNDSVSTKNISQKQVSEINVLPTRTPKKKKNHSKKINLREFNTNHETEIHIFERTYEEVNDQNINDSDYRDNVNQKTMSEVNALADISLGNDFSNDNENIPTKIHKKKKNRNKSLNSIELNTNNDADFKTYKKDNEHNINESDSTKNISKIKMSEVNTLADISLGNDFSNDNENIPTKIHKKKKNRNKSLNSIELNTNNDADFKTYKKDNEHNINESDSTKNISKIKMSEVNTLADISLRNDFSNDNENVLPKIPKKKKNRNKSLNSIELNTNNDGHFGTYERDNEHNINDSDSTKNMSQKTTSEGNASADISLGNDFNNDNENIPTKIHKKKKNRNKSLNSIELNTNNDADFKTYKKDNEHNINESDSTKNISKIKMSEVNTLADISLRNDFSNDNENVLPKIPKKKKNRNKSLNSIELNTNNDGHFGTYERDNEHNINDSDSTKNMSQKTTSEGNASADISLGNDFNNDNEKVSTKIHKKKKNCNNSLNSIELNTNNDVDFKTYKKDNEHNINESDSTKNISKIKMSEVNALADISLRNDFSNDNENVLPKIPKKKKNRNKSLNSIELNTNNDGHFGTYERDNEHNINDSDSTKNMSQKTTSEGNALADISLGNDFNNDNEKVSTKIHKKKKNCNNSLNSIELNTNNDADFKTYKKDNEHNINESDSTKNISKIKMSEVNALADISLRNDFSNDNENVLTKIPKKKKNRNKSLNSIELNTNNDGHFGTYERDNEHNINDSNSTKNMSQKTISEVNVLADISLGNDFSNDNENVLTKIPKKKKNCNKSLNSIELNTNNDGHFGTYERDNEHNINDSNSTKNMSQKTISEVNVLADISLGNDFSNDNENVLTKIPKKKKNRNKSLNSIELNTNNDGHFGTYERDNEHNINDSNSTKNMSQETISEMNALADISLGNYFSNDNENVPTKIPKKKKNRNKCLNSIELNTNHDTEIFESMCEEVSEPNMNNSDTKSLASTSLEINYSLDNENFATKESEKRKKHDIITDNLSIPMISQNSSRIKTLLNFLESYNFEESSTNNTNLNLKPFNLLKYLINKDSSLKNHPNFYQINEHLSKKIKQIINIKCETKASDILILKIIGKIILKRIVEKINSVQDIKNLVIKLPPECMENKIHFIETSLSRLPTKREMDIIKKHNPLIKLRVFNKDEDNIIREYWSKFQKEYNISSVLPFLSNGVEISLRPTERLQFIRYIAAGLPNRLLYSVFNRFNILFNEYQDKTSFSEEEDQLIIRVDECGAIKNKFSVLSLILNRTRLQLYRRHEILKNHHKECKKIKWDDQKRQELFTNILLETNTKHWTHLKNLTLTKEILTKVAKTLGKDLTHFKVRYQWNYLYTMLFCEKPIFMSTFKLTVFELIQHLNPKHWSDLDWREITNKLYPGAKSSVICAFFNNWIDSRVPSNIKENVRDTLDYLKWHLVDKLKMKIDNHDDRKIPRLTVNGYDLLVNKND